MGLAMVHGIVESYDGKISVTSETGKGSRFTIYLPITSNRETRQPYDNKALPTGNERILIVDDEAPIARIECLMLERLGYKVTTKTSSLEALDLFRSQPEQYDLCLSDMTMPDMAGDRLAVELMKIRPDIPVVICSGYSRRMSETLAAKCGIKAFAYKPVVKADLAQTVRKVLDAAKGSIRS